MFDPEKLNKRDKRIMQALLYFYPRKRSAFHIYEYISKFNQKSGVKNPKALGHILSRFPVKASLTVFQSYIDQNILGSRFVRLYVLDESFVKKYYKEKNGLLVLAKNESPKSKSSGKNGE